MRNEQKAIATVIKQSRNAIGMRQQVLADTIGVTRTSVSNIENAKQALTLKTFIRIAKALHEEPAILLDRALASKRKLTVTSDEVDNPKIRKVIEDAIQTSKEG